MHHIAIILQHHIFNLEEQVHRAALSVPLVIVLLLGMNVVTTGYCRVVVFALIFFSFHLCIFDLIFTFFLKLIHDEQNINKKIICIYIGMWVVDIYIYYYYYCCCCRCC
jgi:hypothetical protein